MALPMAETKPWYSEGLHFKCTGCGQCCTGSPGYVWLNLEEAESIARHLGITLEAFGKKYLRQVGDKFSLVEDPVTYDCVFLKENKCSIYSLRPKQCRTFPWWISNLKSKRDWNEAASMCEGINHPDAPLISGETIHAERDEAV